MTTALSRAGQGFRARMIGVAGAVALTTTLAGCYYPAYDTAYPYSYGYYDYPAYADWAYPVGIFGIGWGWGPGWYGGWGWRGGWWGHPGWWGWHGYWRGGYWRGGWRGGYRGFHGGFRGFHGFHGGGGRR